MSDPGYTIFDSETGLTMLKWAITILVAGFIAQFGKKFAAYLIEKFKNFKNRKTAKQTGTLPGGSPTPIMQGYGDKEAGNAVPVPGKAELKYNKKMLKAQGKERKKK